MKSIERVLANQDCMGVGKRKTELWKQFQVYDFRHGFNRPLKTNKESVLTHQSLKI